MSRVGFSAMVSLVCGLFVCAGLQSCSWRTAQAHPIEPDVNVNFPFVLKKAMVIEGPAEAVAWSPDGSRIAASGNFGQTIKVWDASGHLLQDIRGAGGSVAINGYLQFVNGDTQLVFESPPSAPDDAGVSVWDTVTGEDVADVGEGETGGRMNRAPQFCVSEDSKYVALNRGRPESGFERAITLYNTTNWRPIRSFNLPRNAYMAVACFGGGKFVTAGSGDGDITLIPADGRGVLTKFHVYDPSANGDQFIGAVAGSPDGKFVAAGRTGGTEHVPPAIARPGADPAQYRSWRAQEQKWERSQPVVRVIRISDGAKLADFSLSNGDEYISMAKWDPKRRYLAFMTFGHYLFLWNLFNPSISYSRTYVPNSLYFSISPSGDRIAVSQGSKISMIELSPKITDDIASRGVKP